MLNKNVIFLPLPTPANLRFSSRPSTLSWLRGGGLYFFLRSSKSVDLVALVTFPRYILGTLCHLIFLTTVHWVQYRLAGSRKINFFLSIIFFSFAYLIYLFPKLDIYFYFLILMTGSASNMTLKLVVLHDELESVKHGVLRDALVEVSGTQVHFRSISGITILRVLPIFKNNLKRDRFNHCLFLLQDLKEQTINTGTLF